MTVTVDIWTDIACPWCFIGKRRFDAAVALLDHPVEVEFHSFLLAPDAPTDAPGSHLTWLAGHLGVSEEQADQMAARVTALAADEGLAYDYAAIRTTNTWLAHQLVHVAAVHGQQATMVERLSSAYFEQGCHLGRIDELAALAQDVGLDPAAARRDLETERYADCVHRDLAEARRLGIHAVPFFVIDGRWGVSGAQPVETLLAALRQATAA